jgi:hypothetical protein
VAVKNILVEVLWYRKTFYRKPYSSLVLIILTKEIRKLETIYEKHFVERKN